MMKEYKGDKRVLIPRDEFEEEAGEGLGGLGRDEAEADLLELKGRMERRLRRPRAIWLPAAAAVVILLVGSALVVTLLRERPESEPDLALAEEAVTDTAYIAMAGPIEREESVASSDLKSSVAASKGKKAAFGPLLSVANDEVSEVFADDEEALGEVIVVQGEQDDVVFAVVQEAMAEEVVVQAVPQIMITPMNTRTKTADRETVTAAESRKDKAAVDAAAKKEAAAVEAVTEGRKDAVAAEAPAGAAAVPGTGMPDRPAAPAGGWSDYSEYVLRNIQYPEGVTPVLRQEVMVSFTVRSDSTLADMKAVRSPGEPFTREVFRLLREGPRWAPARIGGNPAETEVVVMFVFR